MLKVIKKEVMKEKDIFELHIPDNLRKLYGFVVLVNDQGFVQSFVRTDGQPVEKAPDSPEPIPNLPDMRLCICEPEDPPGCYLIFGRWV